MKAGLFVTCLVDLMRPRIGFAALRLLEAAGCEVVVPTSQTRGGQPAWNSGDLGCMLNIEGKLRRMGDEKTKVLHIAEVLAGET